MMVMMMMIPFFWRGDEISNGPGGQNHDGNYEGEFVLFRTLLREERPLKKLRFYDYCNL